VIHFILALLLAQTYRSSPHDDLMNFELQLRGDGTYTFTNESASCWFYFSEEGTWSEKRGTITLRHVVPRVATVDVKSQSGDRASVIKVTVADIVGRPLPNVEVSVNEGVPAVRTDRAGVALLPRRPSHFSGKADYAFIDLQGTGWTGMATASGMYGQFLLVVHPMSRSEARQTRMRRQGKNLRYGDSVLVPQ
jgi:hypothetical protein